MIYVATIQEVGATLVSPYEYASADAAKRSVIRAVLAEADDQGTEEEREALTHFAEEVNLAADVFSMDCLGKTYAVSVR